MTPWPPRQAARPGDRRPPHAATASWHEDPDLRGRTYAVPFEDVWQAAVRIADGGARGWRLIRADDQEGLITAEATTLVLRHVDDVEIRVSLDDDAQTRVDAFSTSRRRRRDLGTNARRLRNLFRRLDRDVPLQHAARTGHGAQPQLR